MADCRPSNADKPERESGRKLRNNAGRTPGRVLEEDGDTMIHSNTVNNYFQPYTTDFTPRDRRSRHSKSDVVHPGCRPLIREETQSLNATNINSRLSPSHHSPPSLQAPPSPPSTLSSRSSTYLPEGDATRWVAKDYGPNPDLGHVVDTELSTKFGSMLSGNHDDDRPLLAEDCLQNDDGDTVLNELIISTSPDVDGICHLINICPSPNYLDISNRRGQTALHLAVLVDLSDVVRHLLAAGASADACENRHGDNVALLACRLDRGQCLRAIIDGLRCRARVDSTDTELPRVLRLTDREGMSCFHLASMLTNKDIFYYLLMDGCPVDINQQEAKRGATVLHQATSRDDVEVIEALMGCPSIDIHIKTFDGYTAFQMASSGSQARTILPADSVQRSENTSSSSADEMETD